MRKFIEAWNGFALAASEFVVRNADKVSHFGISMAVTIVCRAFAPLWAAAIIALALGVEKEIYDNMCGGRFDFKDIIADVAGAGLPLFIYYV